MDGPIQLLVVNGCSFARGAELSAPEREAWPSLVAARLGMKIVNLACDGGSNRRAVRTTVTYLDDIRRRSGLGYDQILVFCMWTAVSRHERYDPSIEDGAVRPDLGVRPDLPEETHWQRVADWKAAEGDKPSKMYYRHLYHDAGGTVNFLVDWLLLENHLTALGVACRFAFAWDILPRPLPAEAQRLLPALHGDWVHGGLPGGPTDNFREIVHGKVPFGRWDHPLVDGHRLYAREMVRWLGADERLSFPDG